MSHMEGIIMSQYAVAHAVVEPSDEQKASIAHDWGGVKIYQSLGDVPCVSREVVVICSPTINHYDCILMRLRESRLLLQWRNSLF